MAALRGTLTGMRSTISRLGSKGSGIVATLNTWQRRVTLRMDADGSGYIRIEDYTPRSGPGAFTEYAIPEGEGRCRLKGRIESR